MLVGLVEMRGELILSDELLDILVDLVVLIVTQICQTSQSAHAYVDCGLPVNNSALNINLIYTQN